MINKQLSLKYQTEFSFFESKPINQIIFNLTLKTPTILYKDITTFVDNNQYLKRYYFFQSTANKNEIVERIRMLTSFYQGNLIMKYQYPTMVVTNTKHLFMKRLRRMKKMVAMQDSSDYSSDNQTDNLPLQFSSSVFLETVPSDLSKSAFEGHQSRNSIDNDDSFTSVYEIYVENDRTIYQNQKQLQFQSPLWTNMGGVESSINHLICDFDQIDIELAFKSYDRAMEKTKQSYKQQENHRRQSGHKQIGKNLPTSRIVITPIDYIPNKNAYKLKNVPVKSINSRSEHQMNQTKHAIQTKQTKETKMNFIETNNWDSKFQYGNRPKLIEQIQQDINTFLRPNFDHTSKTGKGSYNDQNINDTYATRNDPQYQKLMRYRSNNCLQHGNHQPNQRINTLFTERIPNGRTFNSSPPQITPQQQNRHQQRERLEFRKCLQTMRTDTRNIKCIKQRAITLLNRAKSEEYVNSLSPRETRFISRYI